MNAIIIPEFSQNTLKPLLCNHKPGELTIMGSPLKSHTLNYLAEHEIEIPEIETTKSLSISTANTNDTIIAIEENLLSCSDISKAIEQHNKNHCDLTVVLRKTTGDQSSRLVTMGKNNTLLGLADEGYRFSHSDYELEGIYILGKSLISHLALNNTELYGKEIIRLAIDYKLKIKGYISHEYSINISTVNDYRKCHTDILRGAFPLPLQAHQVKEGLWIEDNVNIERGVKIETPVYISKGCSIERGAVLGSGTILSKNCTLRSGSSVSHSILGTGCSVSEDAYIDGGILADNITLGQGSGIMENAVIGSGCRIEPFCVINSGIRVWPNKRILKGTRLNDNLVWGSVGTERLFSDGKICGEINVDVTPEFIAKLGSAVGTMFHKQKIGVSFDSAPICSVLAHAFISGLISTGAKVFNFGEQTIPITRMGVIYYNLSAGIHISQKGPDNGFCPEIEFIEKNGMWFTDKSEQELEKTFFNNIFVRSDIKNFQKCVVLKEYKLFYIQKILNSIKSNYFDKNIEIRATSETISEILELLLGEIELRTQYDAKKEFLSDISFNGEKIRLYKSDGQMLNDSQLLSLLSVVMLKHLGCREIVLPVSAPSGLEHLILSSGATIIKCGTTHKDFMNTIIENNLFLQFQMCFDGIFSVLTILDYLNINNISFDDLVESLPQCIHHKSEVECPESRKNNIIKHLQTKFKHNKMDTTDGLKIYQNDGWVLIIPEKYRHYIKIITEADSMETADEISNIFINQIKKLAKPQ